MPAPQRDLTFGSFMFPKAAHGPGLLAQARLTEELGYDLIGVPDHPDFGHYIDQWVLMSAILGHTSSVEVFGVVSALALREPPAVLAKAASSMDSLAPGRFHFGIGSGALPGIPSIGGPVWGAGESVNRVREAIELTRLMWSGAEKVDYAGTYYQLREATPPPAPSPSLDLWVGATQSRMRRLTARIADGWIPGMLTIDPDQIRVEVEEIDAELERVGRARSAVRRVYNTIAKKVQPASEGFLIGPAEQWVDQLTEIVLEFGFDTILYGDRAETVTGLHVFAEEIMPAVRANVASATAAAQA